MAKAKWFFYSLLAGLVFQGCHKVLVDDGPFPIEFSETNMESKERYLRTVARQDTTKNKPNILLILVDDLGRDDISLYHAEGVHTPHLSRLAASGVVFTDAYSSSSVCSPSRASLLTGRYQHRFGFERQPMNRYPRNRFEYLVVDRLVNTEPMRLLEPMASPADEHMAKQGIPPGEILLPEVLQAREYHTGIFGKWHLGFSAPFLPNARGFDEQYGFYEAFTYYSPPGDPDIVNYKHDYFANKHIWRQKRKGSCAIRLNDSIIAEEEYLTFAIADRTIDFIDRHKNEAFFAFAAFSAPHTPFQVPSEYYERFDHIQDTNKRVYYAMISALDDAIGRIVDKLEAEAMLENTLILFASDNGGASYTGATDNGTLNAGKMTQFEGGVNVPCLLTWKGKIPEGSSFQKPVSLMDLFATALHVSGVSMPDDRVMDGVNLIPYLNREKEGSPHKALYWRTDFNKSVRYGQWKFIWNVRDEQVFLFHLEKDREELENLADQHPDLVGKLKKEILIWEQGLEDPAWPGVMEIRFDINGEITWWAI